MHAATARLTQLHRIFYIEKKTKKKTVWIQEKEAAAAYYSYLSSCI
jgi:hypothetical protein